MTVGSAGGGRGLCVGSVDSGVCAQVEDYEEEPLLRKGCKEYFWLLCKLIDNIHVKDAGQVGVGGGSAAVGGAHMSVELLLVSVCLDSEGLSLSVAGGLRADHPAGPGLSGEAPGRLHQEVRPPFPSAPPPRGHDPHSPPSS